MTLHAQGWTATTGGSPRRHETVATVRVGCHAWRVNRARAARLRHNDAREIVAGDVATRVFVRGFLEAGENAVMYAPSLAAKTRRLITVATVCAPVFLVEERRR
jgi:hypothetical protein